MTKHQVKESADSKDLRSPLCFYKYLKKEHANALCKYGRIRIGTLYDFRRQEHGQARGDSEEGTKDVTVESFTGDVRDLPPVTQHILNFENFDDGTMMKNISFDVPFESPDHFVFCVSCLRSRDIKRAFQANAIVRIAHPARFFSMITDELFRIGWIPTLEHLVGPCYYTQRSMEHSDLASSIHPALLKAPDYSSQGEWRGLWSPAKSPIPPYLDLEISGLVGTCDRLE